jgi:DNA-binding winged helix-turn-helix (wHTH) protein
MTIAIGACRFDALRREVRRGTERLHISPKGFELLGLLLARRPRAISKDELFSLLWPTTFVTEASLAVLVAEIRRELGDDARVPRYVRTVHGFGYAFSEDGVTENGDDASVFRLIWGVREVSLSAGENILGRELPASVHIDDATVSRHHARIVVGAGRAELEDLGSKNGTWVRGARLAGAHALADGDELRFGSVPMTFRCFGAELATETRRD